MKIHKSLKHAIVFLVVLVLGLIATGETHAKSSDTTEDGFSYILVNDPRSFHKYSATIIGYNGSKNNISIPEKIKGAYVHSIEERAFFGCSNITEVKFHPDVLLRIGPYAFGDCSNLTLLDLPDAVFYIGSGAFSGCSSLKSVQISANVNLKSTGFETFSHCSSLTSVDIPSNVTRIGDRSFSYCSSLTSIDIPNSVTSIGSLAFSYCSSLTSLVIPSSVTHIESHAFYECTNLSSVNIPPSVISIGEYAFYGCDTLTIRGYTGSYAEAYAKTKKLPFSALDSGMTEEMFSYTTDRDSATITGFTGLDAIIYIPAQVKGMTVSRIGPGAFREMSSLVSIFIPPEITSIGNQAFFGCSSLKTVSLPAGLAHIGDWSFSKCVSLMAADIPSGVKSIGNGAFSGCISLTSLTIPFGVTDVGEAAFRKCHSLETVDISFSVTNIGDFAFYGCSKLTKVTIPSKVSSIGKDAFLYTPAVIHGYAGSYAETYAQEHSILFVVIDTQASGITESGFSYDINGDKLTITGYAGSDTDITLPEFIEGIPVTGIGEKIFPTSGKDSRIASLTVPSDITRIDANAFDGCAGLMMFGYKGSKAETYARNASIPFTALDEQTEPTPPPYAELRIGSSGQEVLDMKQRFYELGYYRTTDFSDKFNANTADTVKQFEKNNGLKVDGVADAVMLGVLFSVSAVGK